MNLPNTMTPAMVADVARTLRRRSLSLTIRRDRDGQAGVPAEDQPEIEAADRPLWSEVGRHCRLAGGLRRGENARVIHTTKRRILRYGEEIPFAAIDLQKLLIWKDMAAGVEEFRLKNGRHCRMVGAIPVPSRPAAISRASPGIWRRRSPSE